MNRTMSLRICALIGVALLLTGCAELVTTGKVVATPFTVVRDVVDAPLVTATNAFETWADRTNPRPTPGANVGWTWRGGLDFGVGLNVSHWLFKGLSWTFGPVDYLLGRSVWPNWPNGLSPWLTEGQSWGDLYFPSTRTLWSSGESETTEP
jgi:hypothetical protein